MELRHLGPSRSPRREYARDELRVGAAVAGPAVIREGLSTTVRFPARSRVGRHGELLIERSDDRLRAHPRARDEEFAERYCCDRFTATVLASRFGYVVEHMCSRLLTAAFTPILRDFYDFAATITGPPERG